MLTSIDYSGANKPDSSIGGVSGVIIPPIQWDKMAQAQGALGRHIFHTQDKITMH